MPIVIAKQKARQDKKEGKAPSTQASHFVQEEIDQARKKKSATKSTKQAIAIGLSKARQAGVDVPPKPAKRGKKVAGKQTASKKTAGKRTA